MRLVTFIRPNTDAACPGAIRTGPGGQLEIVDLNAFDAIVPPKVLEVMESWDSLEPIARAAVDQAPGIPFDQATLLAPILNPQKIICVGLNYADHAAETGATVGDEPVIFNKFPTCLRGPEAPIELPPESNEVDYEAELVIVIGLRARRVSREQAWAHVAGYCCGHDVSARDWQKNKPGRQWLLGKGFDSFAPLGPWLVTRDEIPDPHNLPIELKLNGQVMQSSNTRQLIFKIDYLVSYLSHVCTLMPGDLLFTGTPSGVGAGRTPPVFLKPGDVAEVTIEGLGTLRNPVVAGGK